MTTTLHWQSGTRLQWGLCEYVIVHTILGGSPVILWISLGGKPKWLPLNFKYHDVMRTSPIKLSSTLNGFRLFENPLSHFSFSSIPAHAACMDQFLYQSANTYRRIIHVHYQTFDSNMYSTCHTHTYYPYRCALHVAYTGQHVLYSYAYVDITKNDRG